MFGIAETLHKHFLQKPADSDFYTKANHIHQKLETCFHARLIISLEPCGQRSGNSG